MRRRRYIRRRINRRPLTKRALRVHHFKRSGTPFNITGSTVDVFGGYSFSLNDVPAVTEFTNLYDQYRLNKVVVKWIPLTTETNVGQSTTLFYSVLDFNDDVAPTTEAEILQYASLRISQGLRTHTRVLTPASLDDLTDDTGGTRYAGNPKTKQWISTSAPTAPHYGIKFFRPAQPAAQLVNYKVMIMYYFSCRSVK